MKILSANILITLTGSSRILNLTHMFHYHVICLPWAQLNLTITLWLVNVNKTCSYKLEPNSLHSLGKKDKGFRRSEPNSLHGLGKKRKRIQAEWCCWWVVNTFLFSVVICRGWFHVVVLLKYSSQLPFGHIDGIFVAVDVARWSQLVLFVALFCDGVMWVWWRWFIRSVALVCLSDRTCSCVVWWCCAVL